MAVGLRLIGFNKTNDVTSLAGASANPVRPFTWALITEALSTTACQSNRENCLQPLDPLFCSLSYMEGLFVSCLGAETHRSLIGENNKVINKKTSRKGF